MFLCLPLFLPFEQTALYVTEIVWQPLMALFCVIPISFIKHGKKPDHIHRTKSFKSASIP